ncbi:hypothetical protein OG21DRAFT_1270888 [Imleria badia]|nr:hypothetical protein OG21DRAFT_1270888 [Imleria badia]
MSPATLPVTTTAGATNAEADAEKQTRIANTILAKDVYDDECLRSLLTSSSIRGRGTTIFCVFNLEEKERSLALKMSRKDLERVADQDVASKNLEEHRRSSNVIVLLKTLNAEGNANTCRTFGAIRGFLSDQIAGFPVEKSRACMTLDAIRGFLDEQIDHVPIENRVLTISVSKLKRPVKYFWGLHDFVRGLRGALLGHEYLSSIGILHRNISENSIVLGLYPWEERGYLIDFDIAILQDAEEPTQVSSTQSSNQLLQLTQRNSTKPSQPHETKHVKGLRTVGMFTDLAMSSPHIIARALSLTFPGVFSWTRDTRILMTWSRSFMCFCCSFSPMQAPFPRRTWRMPTKRDSFDLSGAVAYLI